MSEERLEHIHWTSEEGVWYSSTQHLRCRTNLNIRLNQLSNPYINLGAVLGRFENGLIAKVNSKGGEIVISGKSIISEVGKVKLSYGLYKRCISKWNELFVFRNGKALYLCPSETKNKHYLEKMDMVKKVPVVTYDVFEGNFDEPIIKRNKNENVLRSRSEIHPVSLKAMVIRSLSDGRSNTLDVVRQLHKPYTFQIIPVLPSGNGTFDQPPIRTREPEEMRYPIQASDAQEEGRHDMYNTNHRETHASVPATDGHSFQLRTPSRYENYTNVQKRIETFSLWPHPPEMQNHDRMANYGLFFIGPHDLVRCYHCGIGLKDWSYSDDPLYEHIRYSPHCEHIVQKLDPQLLQHYRSFLLPSTNAEQSSERHSPNEATPEAAVVTYRNPEYQVYDVRVSSFSKWPRDIIQTPEQLADAGFFYTGMEDVVRCYCCDGGLQRWDPEDDPWVEHARWFPQCQHVIRVKGIEYINLVQLAMDHGSEDEDEAGVIAQGMNVLQINNEHGAQQPKKESDDPIYSPAAQSVIGFGYSRTAVRMAIDECIKKRIRWKAEDLLNILLDTEDRGEVLPTDSPRPESPDLQLHVDPSTPEGLLQERSILLSRLKCIMCEENDVNVLFLPCAHHKMCLDCVKDVTMCPVCEKTIKEKVRTFMA